MGMFFVLSKFINSDITGIAGPGCTTATGPTIGRSNYTPRITNVLVQHNNNYLRGTLYQKNENHSPQFELAPYKKSRHVAGFFISSMVPPNAVGLYVPYPLG